MLAPLAIMPMVSPLHIVGAMPVMAMFTVGVGFTVTVTVVLSEQLPLAPTTVYVCVAAGLALGFEQLVQLKPVAGVHVKFDAPLAVNVILLPLHIDGLGGVTVTFNVAPTVTVTVCVPVQLPLVPVTV